MTTTSLPSNLFPTAKWLVENGFSVIPVRRSNKKPLIRWKPFEDRIATHEEVKQWWHDFPDANVGIVTGKVSNIIVIDADSEDAKNNLEDFLLPDTFITPKVKSPNGWHYYFRYAEGFRCGSNILEKVDIRTDGGYIIAPPSMNGNGTNYSWVKGLKLGDLHPQKMPSALHDTLLQALESSSFSSSSSFIAKTVPNEATQQTDNTETTKDNILFRQGNRDQSLFHAANCLVKGGMRPGNISQCLEILASGCTPPFDPNELSAKINSAMDRAKKRDIGLTKEIREWVLTTNGNFSTTFAYNELDLTTKDNKKKAGVIFGRLCEEGIIERFGDKRGHFRRIERDMVFESLLDATDEPVDVWLPLRLNRMARIFPGNIICIAGAPNSGKTAFMLACTRQNFRKHNVRFLSSEMGIDEAKGRIIQFPDISIEEWQKNWQFSEAYDNFQDRILTGKGNLNIIDYLEQPEGEAFRAAEQLKQIHKKLDGAVAIIAIQKNRGVARDTGVGGDQTLAKPRLYISMDYGTAKIVKCKSWVQDQDNPNWKVCDFKLHAGCQFELNSRGWTKQ